MELIEIMKDKWALRKKGKENTLMKEYREILMTREHNKKKGAKKEDQRKITLEQAMQHQRVELDVGDDEQVLLVHPKKVGNL